MCIELLLWTMLSSKHPAEVKSFDSENNCVLGAAPAKVRNPFPVLTRLLDDI